MEKDTVSTKDALLSDLGDHGSLEIKLPEEEKPTLIYTTSWEMDEQELKTLFLLTKHYHITLYTQ